ncbi:MAG: outer membrane lipid asymmetry maintenance protein MlaD [Pseudomonadales bacterium]|jgi:phospholipid/cholesterol/gamma-HCH transport system substrate-binding protein|nr:outer membrane lipid asymmetry maintenance protein MlaD [Pseudomonadales bacterium]
MQMRTIEIVVGAFMLAGLISLGILATRISGFNVDGETNTYTVYASFENVSGLTVRSKVSIAGVEVGQVAAIDYDRNRYDARVRMEIDGSVDNISVDSTAAILTEGLLGGKYIGLSIGAEDEFLEDGSEITDTQSAIILEELIGQFLLDQF